MFTKKNIILMLCVLAIMVFCFADPSYAAFETLTQSGQKIFEGLKKIIYPASAVGIITVCMGGFFGNVNWKWLTAIVIGLIVISACASFVGMFVDDVNSIPKGSLDGK
jgi:type IV secretory pathway VirB2 component (pilin)